MKEYTGTMPRTGQVTIPAEIRRRLGLKPQDRVRFLPEADGVKVQQPEDWTAVRREFEEMLADDVASEDRR